MSNNFNINTSEIVQLTNKLEKLHKSAMPVTVRGALNDVAFYMKKNEVAKAFDRQFIVRKKTFIRSHTSVNKSLNTFDIKKMSSEVGIIKSKPVSEGLKNQELGQKTKKTKHIPFIDKGKTPVRIGKSHLKQVSKGKRLSQISGAININGIKNPFKNQKFIKAAFSGGKGTIIKYNDTLGVVRAAKKTKTGIFIKFERLYSISKENTVKLNKAPFLVPAAKQAFKKMNYFFIERAKKKIKL